MLRQPSFVLCSIGSITGRHAGKTVFGGGKRESSRQSPLRKTTHAVNTLEYEWANPRLPTTSQAVPHRRPPILGSTGQRLSLSTQCLYSCLLENNEKVNVLQNHTGLAQSNIPPRISENKKKLPIGGRRDIVVPGVVQRTSRSTKQTSSPRYPLFSSARAVCLQPNGHTGWLAITQLDGPPPSHSLASSQA
jgi:hypothetical protein